MTIAHWDDVQPQRVDEGQLGSERYDLGTAAGSLNVGVKRLVVRSGKLSSPVHIEGDEEEIFYVLGGSALSWQDGETHEVGPGDCLVHHASGKPHTMLAGEAGLDVLAFGERSFPTTTHLPRAGILRMDVNVQVLEGPTAFQREGKVGDLDTPPPSPRPNSIVNVDDVEGDARDGPTVARRRRDLARTAGSVRTGLKVYETRPGKLATPPHCHSAEEELFVVLDGDGQLLLGDNEHAVRRGHIVARPPGTGIAHAFRAGENGLTFLAYGTREPNDICFYPRSGKVFFRGVNLVARIESLDYWEGEE
ncbi:MAG: cupin domain-containing protein [Actinobacteria bacterium]|nr:MAG: cupin domain-containing protein [Actinomycetota bacterium]